MVKNIISILFISLFLNSCGQNDVWTGYVYPDPSNLANYRYVGSFDSLQACRSQCLYAIDVNNYRNGDYECGLNCKNKNGLNVCEKTSR
jgi:hypothetical protein